MITPDLRAKSSALMLCVCDTCPSSTNIIGYYLVHFISTHAMNSSLSIHPSLRPTKMLPVGAPRLRNSGILFRGKMIMGGTYTPDALTQHTHVTLLPRSALVTPLTFSSI